ncbi:MAG: PQQ-dependent sugar dehydrogenase [Niabella sp.]|nr:PQQ-dependent sugar dehydrogenase [Niabella sp.]
MRLAALPVLLSVAALLASCHIEKKKEPPVLNTIRLGQTAVSLTRVADHLEVPWDLEYDRKAHAILFSEIAGVIKRLDLGTHRVFPVARISEVYHQRTTGLLGMALYQPEQGPDYLFLSYTSKTGDSIYSNLLRYTYNNGKLEAPLRLLRIPGSTGHNGSRVLVAKDQKVYWATGDAASDTFAQDSTALNGKILRLNLDGSIPKDNPIPNSYVYAWGFRNMQGLTQSGNGTIYTSEHGDAIEDEINLIRPLQNYGWPQIEGKHDTEKEIAIAKKSPRTEPVRSWTPVIAPAGLAWYGSDAIPEWKNSLLLTTLKSQSLRILHLSANGQQITDEAILFANYLGRLRSVLVLPDGTVYFCTSNRDWNPQQGFPKPYDDGIYCLEKTTDTTAPVLRPQKPPALQEQSGKALYESYCASCHKTDGKGLLNTFPSLAGSRLVNGDANKLLQVLLHGANGKASDGISYEASMPAFAFLKDEEIRVLTNYIRSNFGNASGNITSETVKNNR